MQQPTRNLNLPALLLTRNQSTLAQLVDDSAQREQALVDGCALLHADALSSCLGYALRACQVNQRECGHQDGTCIIACGVSGTALNDLQKQKMQGQAGQ